MRKTGLLKFNDTLLFLDEKGHTSKSKIEYDKHKNLEKLRKLASDIGKSKGFLLTEKPVTIINKCFYNNLVEVVEQSFEMWKRIGYWDDNILFRSASYFTKQGLLSNNFPNNGLADAVCQIKTLISEAGNPDQILLHPVPSDELFKGGFFATRCWMLDGVCEFEVGHGGIDQTFKLEQGECIVKGKIFNEPVLETVYGTLLEDKKNIIERIGYGLHEFCLLAPGLVAPKIKQGNKPVIYEFKSFYLKELDKVVIEFIDYEVYK
ncbi:hypothetical protein KBD45_05955 [Candidatus Dojkabacteria bacterium]|nr:hypothetical protein [Candidatus Dojkabacteria bacterium]